MPHFTSHERNSSSSSTEHAYLSRSRRDPDQTNVYLVGGGIASLAAATHFIHDAKVPASQIHILESLAVPGGSMDGAGDTSQGYILRGGRMLNYSYGCLYDLLDLIPSLTEPNKTVLKEIQDYNKEHQTNAQARVVASGSNGPERVNVTRMGFSNRDRVDMLKMLYASEKSLGVKKIEDCFRKEFFQTNFWYMWATTFAFNPWHGAVEFRRYLHRFLHEFPRINTLAGIDRTPYNQFDSIILPMTRFLEDKGTDFQYNTRVTGITFSETKPTRPIEIQMIQSGVPKKVIVKETDLVFVTPGSMTSESSIGTNDTAPCFDPDTSDGTWALWKNMAEGRPEFGNPSNFCERTQESNWESFTVTSFDPEFLNRYIEFSHNEPGTGALVTFKDSNWFMSIVVPRQPHFINQPENVNVFWGYGLFTDREGNYVKKPMSECTGKEIMTELLGHLNFPLHPILDNSITRPCMMPYITSQFLTRRIEDRPKVMPKGTTNLALLGQFVEIPEDTVFTVEYSVRAAQMAVFELMGLKKKPKPLYKGEHHVGILIQATEKLLS
ncbi:MAG: hypothetical protein M1834_005451 [Cirrosporium novae-zelandiae]|nr:MAG: hypothetical protein M1834_005451 [Cirrosporium novae-zelandiae]